MLLRRSLSARILIFAGQAVSGRELTGWYAVPGASFHSKLPSIQEFREFFLGVQEPDYTKDVVKVNVPVLPLRSELELFNESALRNSGSEIPNEYRLGHTLVAVSN